MQVIYYFTSFWHLDVSGPRFLGQDYSKLSVLPVLVTMIWWQLCVWCHFIFNVDTFLKAKFECLISNHRLNLILYVYVLVISLKRIIILIFYMCKVYPLLNLLNLYLCDFQVCVLCPTHRFFIPRSILDNTRLLCSYNFANEIKIKQVPL